MDVTNEFMKFLLDSMVQNITDFVVPQRFKKEWDKINEELTKICLKQEATIWDEENRLDKTVEETANIVP